MTMRLSESQADKCGLFLVTKTPEGVYLQHGRSDVEAYPVVTLFLYTFTG